MGKVLLGILVIFALGSCRQQTHEQSDVVDSTWVKYAHGFKIRRVDGLVHLFVTQPFQNTMHGYHYILVPHGIQPPTPHPAAAVQAVIQVPIESVVCTSTTHIPHLDYLGLTDRLIGFPTMDYISSENMRKRIDAGDVTELGIDKGMDLEKLYSLHPSLVIGYQMTADFGQLRKIQDLGIPVVINAEYLEGDPLGRAEWIKFTSLFFGKEREADSVFAAIEREYNRVKQLASATLTRPTVMSGIVYGDTWFLPGGRNYAATLLSEAGCQYLWSDNESNGFLELSFESVFQKARGADLWIGVGSFGSLDELKAAESRYSLFKPFETGQVYSYNARIGAKGGNDFLESGYLRPDLILKDLVKISHPDLIGDHELYFHQLVKP